MQFNLTIQGRFNTEFSRLHYHFTNTVFICRTRFPGSAATQRSVFIMKKRRVY